jgi:HEAT repeat protein
VPHRSSTIVIGLMLVGAGGALNAQDVPVVAVKDGLLTASIRNHPIVQALGELGAKTGIALVPAADIEQDTISADLQRLPVDQGLRQLLKNYDTFFYYSGSADAPAVLRAVWIYRKGTAALLQPVPPETWADRRELEEMTTQRDPVIREQAYEALMSRPDQESRELLMRAIRGETEPDSGLRQRILSTAITKSVQFPPEILSYLAVTDPSEEIRWMALDALSTDPAVKETAEMASSDPSEAVRSRANEILAGIKAAARRQQ